MIDDDANELADELAEIPDSHGHFSGPTINKSFGQEMPLVLRCDPGVGLFVSIDNTKPAKPAYTTRLTETVIQKYEAACRLNVKAMAMAKKVNAMEGLPATTKCMVERFLQLEGKVRDDEGSLILLGRSIENTNGPSDDDAALAPVSDDGQPLEAHEEREEAGVLLPYVETGVPSPLHAEAGLPSPLYEEAIGTPSSISSMWPGMFDSP
ncbi:MAG: hypothetical protein SGARI_003658, partial [Bacillariaceae sp.]